MVLNNNGDLQRESHKCPDHGRPSPQSTKKSLLVTWGICLPCFHSLADSRRLTECWLTSVWSRDPLVQGEALLETVWSLWCPKAACFWSCNLHHDCAGDSTPLWFRNCFLTLQSQNCLLELGQVSELSSIRGSLSSSRGQSRAVTTAYNI